MLVASHTFIKPHLPFFLIRPLIKIINHLITSSFYSLPNFMQNHFFFMYVCAFKPTKLIKTLQFTIYGVYYPISGSIYNAIKTLKFNNCQTIFQKELFR
jgi:hypothetical protein